MSNEIKQTAVEWFSNKTWRLKVQLENKEITIGEYGVTYVELLEQAKEMEKQQIIDAHFDGQHCNEWGNIPAEKFYNETYGGNK